MKKTILAIASLIAPAILAALPPVQTIHMSDGEVYFGYIKQFDPDIFVAEKGIYIIPSEQLFDLERESTTKPVSELGDFTTFFEETPSALKLIGNPSEIKTYELKDNDKWGKRILLLERNGANVKILSLKEQIIKSDYNNIDSITCDPIKEDAPGGLYDRIYTTATIGAGGYTGTNILTVPDKSEYVIQINGGNRITLSLDDKQKVEKMRVNPSKDYIFNSPLLSDITYEDTNGTRAKLTGVVISDDYQKEIMEVFDLESNASVQINTNKVISEVSRRNPYFLKDRPAPKPVEIAEAAPIAEVAESNPTAQPKPEAKPVRVDPLADARILYLEEFNDINAKEKKDNLKFWADDEDRHTGKWSIDKADPSNFNKLNLRGSRIIAFEFDQSQAPNISMYKVAPRESNDKIEFQYSDLALNSKYIKEITGQRLDSTILGVGKSAVKFNDILSNSYYLLYNKDANKLYLISTYM